MAPKSKGVIERVEEMLGMGAVAEPKPAKKRTTAKKKAAKKTIRKAAKKAKAKRSTKKAKRSKKLKR